MKAQNARRASATHLMTKRRLPSGFQELLGANGDPAVTNLAGCSELLQLLRQACNGGVIRERANRVLGEDELGAVHDHLKRAPAGGLKDTLLQILRSIQKQRRGCRAACSMYMAPNAKKNMHRKSTRQKHPSGRSALENFSVLSMKP